ncbi:MAG: rubrerythrin family protein [Oscillospiraceae bacterium]|nr:rubrerythrin family protein [Oscillospiraceae bacterium]
MANLKGSRTEANLMSAFADESMARNKYTYYAAKAKAQGYEQIHRIFMETAHNEMEHGKIWFKKLHNEDIPDTGANLLDAADGEHRESVMYADYAQIADDEGFADIAQLFREVAAIETFHEERYRKIYDEYNGGAVFTGTADTQWECMNCGHIHTGESAPMGCPVCKHPQAYFMRKPPSQ